MEHFAEPAVVMESPESVALTTPGSMTVFAGAHHHLTSQRDTQLSVGATIAAVSGNAAGGLKVIANHGPVSLEAHSGVMHILSDDSLSITSTDDTINVFANKTITLTSGQSKVRLDGANIIFECPGTFTVKSGSHAFAGPRAQPAVLKNLPSRTTQLTPMGSATVVPASATTNELKQLASSLVQLIETAKTGRSVLGASLTTLAYSHVSARIMDNTIKFALLDIRYYRLSGLHYPHSQTSAINWAKAEIDWTRYDDGGTEASVLRNFIQDNISDNNLGA